MTKFQLGRGLTKYFLYKGVDSGEEVTHTIYICRLRAGATKTLGLAAMEWKLNIFFLAILRINYFTEGGEGLRVTRNKGKKISDRWKKNKLKEIRDSWICEKVWLKAAKSVSGKWILLKFVRETRKKSPYLPSKVTLAQLFTSFCVVTKRRNHLQPPWKIQQPPTNNWINTNIKKSYRCEKQAR